ncbi:MAG: basic secretory protein-like protein [Candidatus Saccharimonadales bacterium]
MALRISGGSGRKGHENDLIPKDSSASSAGEIKGAEKNPGQDKKGAADALEEGLVKGGMHALSGPSGGALGVMRFFLSNNKRKMTASGFVVTVIVGLLFFFSVGQGPLQLVHLSQILQKLTFGQEKASSLRFKGFIRYFRTGDIGETRLGHFASKSVRKAMNQLSEIGIDFERNTISGAPNKMTVDTNKHPDFKDLPENERLAAVRKHFGITNGNILSKSGSVVSIDIDSTTTKGMRFGNSLTHTALGGLENGKIATALLMRRMAKFFNLPRLYSPIKAAENKAAERLKTRQDRINAEKERAGPRNESTNTRAGPIKERLRPKISSNAAKFGGAALVTTSAICLVRDIATDAVALNYAAVVVPSMLEAEDKIAVGAQTQSGKDITLPQAGNVVEAFTDENGESIWAAKSLNAVATNGPGKGKDISADYQQAFSNKTTADSIKDFSRVEVGGIDISGAACSDIGVVIQAGFGIGLLIAGPFTGGATWGAFAAKTAASTAATAGIMYFIQQKLAALVSTDAIVEPPLGGAVGGNLLAYGKHASAGLSGRTAGGVALSSEDSQALLEERDQEEKEKFQSKSFAERMFNTKDYRSFASSALRPVYSLSFSQKITKSFSLLTQAPSLFSNTFSSALSFFTPKSSAQEKQYNWASPEYGIPSEVLNDPSLQDPYENAGVVAAGLKNERLDDEVERAEKCFGVKIEDGPNGWGVLAEKDTNPTDQKYIDADCDNLDSFNWKRMMLFVHDSQVMSAVACYDGEEEACSDVTGGSGETGGGASPSEEAPPPETTNCEVDFSAVPSMEDLAKFIDRECETGMPAIEDVMGDKSPFNPPYKIKIVEASEMSSSRTLGQVFTAEGQGGPVGTMWLNKDFLRQNASKRDEIRGVLLHELAHVTQGYGTIPDSEKLAEMLGDLRGDGMYQFVTEGGADYVASGFRNVGSSSREQRLHCMYGGWDVYTSGYSCGAALLAYINDKYSNNLIKKLNRSIHSGGYTDSFFSDLTGKDINTLFNECIQNPRGDPLCKGGTRQ